MERECCLGEDKMRAGRGNHGFYVFWKWAREGDGGMRMGVIRRRRGLQLYVGLGGSARLFALGWGNEACGQTSDKAFFSWVEFGTMRDRWNRPYF
mmetsp:Transcript_10351/g.27133  ORF Transcript_10351/g.27133 Transcript_10351/m.27133 type:complete len:95 (+) Transcript_10351:28-312(+)